MCIQIKSSPVVSVLSESPDNVKGRDALPRLSPARIRTSYILDMCSSSEHSTAQNRPCLIFNRLTPENPHTV